LIAWVFGIGPGLDYIKDNTAIVTEVNQLLMKNPAVSLAMFFATLAVAGAVGAVLGLVACYPAIRLREDYLSITLLAMGEAIQVIGYNYTPIAKGNIGVLVPDPFRWAGDQRYAVIAVFVVAISMLVFFYQERLVRSPLGRMLRAIRDNESVAESLGKDTTRIRMKAIIVASVIGAIAGSIDGFKKAGIIATSYQRTSWTFWPWVIVVLGGAVLIQMYRPEGIIREKPTPTLGYKRLKRFVSPRSSDSNSKKNAPLLNRLTSSLSYIWKKTSALKRRDSAS